MPRKRKTDPARPFEIKVAQVTIARAGSIGEAKNLCRLLVVHYDIYHDGVLISDQNNKDNNYESQ
jgi:hypothetical protein